MVILLQKRIMIVSVIFNKIKHFLLVFVGVFRRALCCFQRRRRMSFDAVPLTHVGVDGGGRTDAEENWGWEERLEHSEPKTIQDHIELYRKKKVDSRQIQNDNPEERLDFFEDMTPRITRQTKLFIDSQNSNDNNSIMKSRLDFVGDAVPFETEGELREWEENGGWEGQTMDWDVQEALREKKRLDMERRMWELQQKRQEKSNRSLGAKVST